VNIY